MNVADVICRIKRYQVVRDAKDVYVECPTYDEANLLETINLCERKKLDALNLLLREYIR